MSRSAALLGLIALLLVAAPGARAAAWLPPVLVAGSGVGPPSVAVDDRGDTFMAWVGTAGKVLVAKRPVGAGAFDPPQPLDSSGPNASAPRIGVDGAGNAVVVWATDTGAVKQARRGANDSGFASPTPVDTGPGSNNVRLDVNRSGEAVVAWDRGTSLGTFEAAWALGSTTAAFGAPVVAGPGAGTSYTVSDVRINGAGDAALVFTRDAGSGFRALSSAYRVRSGPLGAQQLIVNQLSYNDGPKVALDEQGRVVAVWTTTNNGGEVLASFRPAGSSGSPAWTSPSVLDSGVAPNRENVAFDSLGQAVATWGGQNDLRTSTRPAGDPPGAQFPGPPPTFVGTNEQPFDSSLASVVPGSMALLWRRTADNQISVALRPPGGSFGPKATLTQAGHTGGAHDVAASSGGNVSAAWVDTNTTEGSTAMASAVYDATPPVFDHSTSVPPAAYVGDSVPMAASATDDWSNPATFTWDFGDGSTGAGAAPSHVYAAPGAYTVAITATDGAGNPATTTRTIVVFSKPPPPVDTPTRGVDFNASSVSGTVLVSVPKNAPAGRVLARPPVVRGAAAITPPAGYTPFRLLGKDDNIPVGSILDATKGVSQITMATNATGTATQLGKFSQGVFKTQQSKKQSLTTALMMGGGNFRRECRKLGFVGKVSAARRRPSRRLFANVKGRFRTRGRHSTATVRGTQYLVKDSCSGTTTRVLKGSVVVHDYTLRKDKTVKAGHRYFARALRRKH